VKYIPGEENLLPDALSHMYAFDGAGATRRPSEFTKHDEDQLMSAGVTHLASIPSLEEANPALPTLRRSSRVAARPVVMPEWLPKHRQPKIGEGQQPAPVQRPVLCKSSGGRGEESQRPVLCESPVGRGRESQ
jgi:hypothetical protein